MMKKDIIEVVKFIRPKFYNKITWLIIAAGITIMSPSIIVEIINFILDWQLKYEIASNWDKILGFSLILIGLGYNLYVRNAELKKGELADNSGVAEMEPVVAKIVRRIVHSGKVLIHYLSLQSGVILEKDYPSGVELKDICIDINPNDLVKGWENANMIQVFKHYKAKSDEAIKDLHNKIAFTSPQLVRMISEIEITPYYNALNNKRYPNSISNVDLLQFEKHLGEYFSLIKSLEEYALKELKSFEVVKF